MAVPYKIRSSYTIRPLSIAGSYIQFGVTIPSFLIPDWSGAKVRITPSGTNCLVLERR